MNTTVKFENWFRDLASDLLDVGLLYEEERIPISPLILEHKLVNTWSRELPLLLDVARQVAVTQNGGFAPPRYDQEEVGRLYLDAPRRPGIMRPDGILVDGELKLLEMNVDSAIGGIWEVGFLQERISKNPRLELPDKAHFPVPKEALRDFIAELVRQIRTDDGGPINVALVLHSNSNRFYLDISQEMCDWISAETPVQAYSMTPQVLRAEDYVTDGQRPYHIVYRLGTLMAEPNTSAPMIRLLRDARHTRSIMLADPLDVFVEHKGTLALLSEALSEEGALNADHAELVQRYVPWTRFIRETETDFRGQRQQLTILAKEAREQLVIKRCYSHVGQQVFIGAEVNPSTWSNLVDNAARAADPWVIQENLASTPYPFTYYNFNEGFVEREKRYTLSPIFLGRHFGGMLVRVEEDPSRRVLALPHNSQMGSAGVALI